MNEDHMLNSIRSTTFFVGCMKKHKPYIKTLFILLFIPSALLLVLTEEHVTIVTNGVTISKVNVGSPMFADDLTLLARVKWGLDSMLQVLNAFGKRWRLMFSTKKTVVLTFGEKPRDREHNMCSRNWKMGLIRIKECTT